MRVHPSERQLGGGAFGVARYSLHRVPAHARCQFFLGGDSESSQTQTTATDNAIVQGKSAIYTAPASINLSGKSAKLVSPGAVDLGGVTGTGNQVTIGTTGDELTDLLTGIATGTTQAVTASTSALREVLQGQADQIGALAEGVQSGGETLWKKPFTWIALAVLAVVALFVLKGK